MKSIRMWTARGLLFVITAAALALGGICLGDTTEYIPKVNQESGKVTGGEKNDAGFAWRKMAVTASGDNITVSFEFKVWNDSKTPITQQFLCIGNKVYLTLYNGVPKAESVEEWRSVKKTFAVELRTPGMTHKMTLAQTQQYSAEDGIRHIEVEGGSTRYQFATLTTK